MSEQEDKYQLGLKYSNARVKWSGLQGLLYGLGFYLLPQILLAVIIAVVAVSRNVEPETLIGNDDFIQIFAYSLFLSVISSWLIIQYVKNKGGLKALGFTKFKASYLKKALIAYGVYIAIFIVAILVIQGLAPDLNLDEEQDIPTPVGMVEYYSAFIALVILPPLYEEILFRGFAFQAMAKSYGFIPAAILVNGVFGLAHGQLNVGIDTFILGVIASWLVWKTKSLWPAIALHAIKNLVAYLLRFVIA